MNDVASLLPLLVIALLFWLLVIRPASRRTKALKTLQGGLEVGSEVMLGSGIYGTVRQVEVDRMQLEISPGVLVTVARQAVVEVVPRVAPETTGDTTADGGGSRPSLSKPDQDDTGAS